ncbi:MAG: hypothetical protein PHI50_04620 [Alphaproteobacteria bacterium]|nr:hypothetical protein [Alphaproteobacteria bacterium]
MRRFLFLPLFLCFSLPSFSKDIFYFVKNPPKTVMSSVSDLAVHSSSEKGNPKASFLIALRLQEKNDWEALKFYEQAEPLQNPYALTNEAILLRRLAFIPKPAEKRRDFLLRKVEFLKKSLCLLEKEVKENNPYAFYALSQTYKQGLGTAKRLVEAAYLTELASLNFDEGSEEKEMAKMAFEEIKSSLSPLQKEFFETYIPSSLYKHYEKESRLDRKEAKLMPFPHISGHVVENKAILSYFRLRKKRRVQEMMMAYGDKLSPDYDNKTLRNIKGLYPVAPFAMSPLVQQNLYYRKDIPGRIKVTLEKEYSVLPALLGDVITLIVETHLHQSKKAPNISIPTLKNSDWNVKYFLDNGVLHSTFFPVFERESKESKTAYMGLDFIAKKTGWSEVQFIPKEKDTPPYIVRIFVQKRKEE